MASTTSDYCRTHFDFQTDNGVFRFELYNGIMTIEATNIKTGKKYRTIISEPLTFTTKNIPMTPGDLYTSAELWANKKPSDMTITIQEGVDSTLTIVMAMKIRLGNVYEGEREIVIPECVVPDRVQVLVERIDKLEKSNAELVERVESLMLESEVNNDVLEFVSDSFEPVSGYSIAFTKVHCRYQRWYARKYKKECKHEWKALMKGFRNNGIKVQCDSSSKCSGVDCSDSANHALCNYLLK